MLSRSTGVPSIEVLASGTWLLMETGKRTGVARIVIHEL